MNASNSPVRFRRLSRLLAITGQQIEARPSRLMNEDVLADLEKVGDVG
jgi:hypothetical protein